MYKPPLYYQCPKQYSNITTLSYDPSPVRGLYCVLTPRSKMCCLAKLSLLCSAPFWLSRVATRASSSWILSSISPSLPADGGPCFNRSSFVDNLNSQDKKLCSAFITVLRWSNDPFKTMFPLGIKGYNKSSIKQSSPLMVFCQLVCVCVPA